MLRGRFAFLLRKAKRAFGTYRGVWGGNITQALQTAPPNLMKVHINDIVTSHVTSYDGLPLYPRATPRSIHLSLLSCYSKPSDNIYRSAAVWWCSVLVAGCSNICSVSAHILTVCHTYITSLASTGTSQRTEPSPSQPLQPSRRTESDNTGNHCFQGVTQ